MHASTCCGYTMRGDCVFGLDPSLKKKKILRVVLVQRCTPEGGAFVGLRLSMTMEGAMNACRSQLKAEFV
jgi:hypothetical protein